MTEEEAEELRLMVKKIDEDLNVLTSSISDLKCKVIEIITEERNRDGL